MGLRKKDSSQNSSRGIVLDNPLYLFRVFLDFSSLTWKPQGDAFIFDRCLQSISSKCTNTNILWFLVICLSKLISEVPIFTVHFELRYYKTAVSLFVGIFSNFEIGSDYLSLLCLECWLLSVRQVVQKSADPFEIQSLWPPLSSHSYINRLPGEACVGSIFFVNPTHGRNNRKWFVTRLGLPREDE